MTWNSWAYNPTDLFSSSVSESFALMTSFNCWYDYKWCLVIHLLSDEAACSNCHYVLSRLNIWLIEKWVWQAHIDKHQVMISFNLVRSYLLLRITWSTNPSLSSSLSSSEQNMSYNYVNSVLLKSPNQSKIKICTYKYIVLKLKLQTSRIWSSLVTYRQWHVFHRYRGWNLLLKQLRAKTCVVKLLVIQNYDIFFIVII